MEIEWLKLGADEKHQLLVAWSDEIGFISSPSDQDTVEDDDVDAT